VSAAATLAFVATKKRAKLIVATESQAERMRFDDWLAHPEIGELLRGFVDLMSHELATHVRDAWMHLDAVEDLRSAFVYRLLEALAESVGAKDRPRRVHGWLDSRFPDIELSEPDLRAALAAWPKRPRWDALLIVCNRLAGRTLNSTGAGLRVSFAKWKRRRKA
jgi:hypothetical protein